MPEEFDFFDDFQDEGGIFQDRNNPPGAAGDPDAIEDLRAESAALPMQGAVAEDGLVAPAPQKDMMGVLLSDVSIEMVCLHGPCKHYTEAVVQEGNLQRTIRRCSRIRTWAEQTNLDDVNVLGCSHHETDHPLHPNVQEKVEEGLAAVADANECNDFLGICHMVSCQHYANILIDKGEGPEIHRWCLHLGGAAKPFKFTNENPVLACTAAKPGRPNDALIHAKRQLAEARARHRKKMEQQ